jgi:hypothetical protein
MEDFDYIKYLKEIKVNNPNNSKEALKSHIKASINIIKNIGTDNIPVGVYMEKELERFLRILEQEDEQ